MTRTAGRQDATLIASAAAGDEIAFRRIIAAHHEDMRRVCAYVAGDLTIADEATQAAWVIAWKRLRDVREPSHLRPWLMTVATVSKDDLLLSIDVRDEDPGAARVLAVALGDEMIRRVRDQSSGSSSRRNEQSTSKPSWRSRSLSTTSQEGT